MGNDLIENNERGIEICHIEDDSFDPVKHGYKKVSKEALENFSLISRYVVNEVVQNSGAKEAEKMLEGAYKVVIKEGMHLGSSSTKKGAVKGLLFSDDKNALVGQADWIKIDGKEVLRSTQIVSGVFNAMSIVTGQYYLSEINRDLTSIKAGVDEIHDFLKTDKASSIKADNITLMKMCRDYDYIMGNDSERLASSVELKRIKSESIKNIEFFKTKSKSVRWGIKPDMKAESFRGKMKELEEYYPQYWCAVFNFILAEALDVAITEMASSEYLTNRYIDANREVMNYKASFKSSIDAINNYIRKSKELNKKGKLPKELADIANAIPTLGIPAVVGVKAAAVGAVGIDNKITNDSKKKKKKAESQKEKLLQACDDCEPLDTVVRKIEEYRVAKNSEAEYVKIGDSVYVKYIEKVFK